MRIHVTTTIKPHLHEIAKKEGIGWSEALERGVLAMSEDPILLDDGVSIESPSTRAKISKLVKANKALQDQLLSLQENHDGI